jgi:hypothetical protein
MEERRWRTVALDPAGASNVGNRAPITDQIARCRFLEVGVHCGVQAAGFILVSVDAVFDLLGRIPYVRQRPSGTDAVILTSKVVCLPTAPMLAVIPVAFVDCASNSPLHRPQSTHLPHELKSWVRQEVIPAVFIVRNEPSY